MASAEEPSIRRLDPDVVNRIAAGEVIHRPANAIKELIENSLDAGATSITVVAKGGGIKLLQISDNGHGIKKEDMDIVCERFTTSKLSNFEDLKTIATYGFRGEALASISHVAHLTITTMTKDSPCAFKAKYSDGKLVPLTPGAAAKPKPCAGVPGTQITVEDLFYNVVTRKRALKNMNEEYNKILNVVIRYATHNPRVAFSCKKFGQPSGDVQTLGGDTDQMGVMTLLFKSVVSRELMEIQHEDDGEFSYKFSAWVSNPNFNRKKGTYIFFINHRLVEVPALKRSIDEMYSKHLPKGTHPFVYLSLEIKPENIDVNVHPTKKEVHFLNESEITAAIQEVIDQKLQECASSRTFNVQPALPSFQSPSPSKSSPSPRKSGTPGTPYQHQLVRTDSRARPLTAFFPLSQKDSPADKHPIDDVEMDYDDDLLVNSPELPPRPQQAAAPIDLSDTDNVRAAGSSEMQDPKSSRSRVVELDDDIMDVEEQPLLTKRPRQEQTEMSSSRDNSRNSMRKQPRTRKYKPVLLTSIRSLISEMEAKSHEELAEVFFNYTFVGCANANFALVQHTTKLYLMNVCALSRELFYQIGLRRFSNFGVIKLSTPAPLTQLALLALESEEAGWTDEDGSKEEIAQDGCLMLEARRQMLEDYFSIKIDEDGNLETLPQIIDNYVPPLHRLPMFVLRLCTEVDWTEEKPCLRGIVEELALFYQLPVVLEGADIEENGSNSRAWTIENVIFPSLRTEFSAPRKFARDRTIVQVACLEKLYKVFERC